MTRRYAVALALGAFLTPRAQADNPPNEPNSAADVVVLRDGSVVLGQVVSVGAFQSLGVLVRRSWVESHLPGPARRWSTAEMVKVRKARTERRVRLAAWRRERLPTAGDPLAGWFEREMARTADMRPPRIPLMLVDLTAADVRSVDRRDAADARLLRLGWRLGLKDVEALSPDDLRAAIEAGPAVAVPPADDRVAVDDLLPLYPEPDSVWRTRRAATEAVIEPALRFVQFRQMLLPETGVSRPSAIPGDRTQFLDTPEALTGFASVEGIRVDNPVEAGLKAAGDAGRTGAIVSRIDFDAGFSAGSAETSLWVRQAGGRWTPVLSTRSSVPADQPEDPSEPPSAGSPIRALVLVLESVAATPSNPEVSDRRRAAAFAARRALGRARNALDRELLTLVLPVPGVTAQRNGAPR